VTLSVIVSTYNWKEALELCLLSLLCGTLLPHEIIVADDGSREDTAELVASFKKTSPVPVVHIWQEDDGYRLARIRNKALSQAQGDYIVLLDGDVIVHPFFNRDQIAVARPGWFSQGSRILLTEEKTAAVLESKEIHFSFWERGLGSHLKAIHSPCLSWLLSSRRGGLKGIRGCNLAFWRRDAFTINGFDEDYTGWGREDSDFAARLMHAGVKRQDVKARAFVYHLHHPPRTRTSLYRNDALLRESLNERRTRCVNGLAGHVSET